jgi:hypothetical protein
MLKRAHIKHPSNKKELSRVTPELAQAIVQTNFRTIQHGIEVLSSLIGIGDLTEIVKNSQLMTFPTNLNAGRKSVKSADEVIQILRAMITKCEKPSCIIFFEAGRRDVSGLIYFGLECDDIEPNIRHSLHLSFTDNIKYNVLFSVGKSVRGR